MTHADDPYTIIAREVAGERIHVLLRDLHGHCFEVVGRNDGEGVTADEGVRYAYATHQIERFF